MKSNKINIFVVDDEPEMLELIRYLFKKFNFAIKTANSGNEAWQFLKDENDFHLVLSDVRAAIETCMLAPFFEMENKTLC